MLPNNVKDLTGQKFGKLRVLAYSGLRSNKAEWSCQCDCGKIKLCNGISLRSGGTRSCGCLRGRRVGPRKPVSQTVLNAQYNRYVQSARARGVLFDLSKAELHELCIHDCEYCGAEPIPFNNSNKAHGSVLYNGVDRKNNTQGYAIENCVPCCRRCNYAKSDMSFEDFKAWVLQVATHLTAK